MHFYSTSRKQAAVDQGLELVGDLGKGLSCIDQGISDFE